MDTHQGPIENHQGPMGTHQEVPPKFPQMGGILREHHVARNFGETSLAKHPLGTIHTPLGVICTPTGWMSTPSASRGATRCAGTAQPRIVNLNMFILISMSALHVYFYFVFFDALASRENILLLTCNQGPAFTL